jgi:hypothetical protein
MKTIRISDEVWKEFERIGRFGETPDDLLRRVLKIRRGARQEPSPGRKSPKTVLRITFPDGTAFDDHIAARSFVKAIEKIGIERVRNLGIQVGGGPLVANAPSLRYGKSQHRLGDHYIMTLSSTKTKKDTLQQIAKKLGLSLRVDIV